MCFFLLDTRKTQAQGLKCTRFYSTVAFLLVLGVVLISPFLVGVAKAYSQNEEEFQTLEKGKQVERPLAPAQIHSYRLTLKANEFIQIVIDQRGVRLRVALSGPTGRQITQIDGPRADRPQRFLFVTEEAGNYTLRISSALETSSQGQYRLRIEEQRSALPQDKTRVDAYRNFAAAQLLFDEASASSLSQAIEKLKTALPLWQLVEDQRSEAITLTQIAKAYDLLGEKDKALDFYNQALPILQGTKDSVGIATTLNNIGLVHDSLGDKQKALDYYNRALPILRAAGDTRVEAYTLTNIGLVYDSVGEKQKALDNYKRALGMLQNVGDHRAEAATLNNIGFVYNSLGEKERALEYFSKAVPILQALGDHRVEAITINNIGHVYESLGDKDNALKYFNQALPILRLVGDRRVEAVTLNNIGLVYSSLRDTQKALEYFDRSLVLRRAVGDRQGEAITLSDTGNLYSSLGQYPKALEYYGEALSLSRLVEDRGLEASILRGRALVARDRKEPGDGLKDVQAAIGIIEALRTKVASQELRASYFASAQQYFETYIDVLMQLHSDHPNDKYDVRALEANERARARSLLEMLTEARGRIREGVDPDLLAREARLQQALNVKAAAHDRLMQGELSEKETNALRNEIKTLVEQYDDIETQIRLSSPRYAALTQPSTLTVQDIQQRVLDPESVLLEYSLGSERSYLWMLTSTSIWSVSLPPRSEIEIAARRIYELLTERNRRVKFETAAERRSRIVAADSEYKEKAKALSQMLLGPAANQLSQIRKKRLLIVTDGALNYLPFAALPTPQLEPQVAGFRPLVRDYEIISLPSASVLDALRRETAGREQPPKTLAVLADPVFESGDSRLSKTNVDSKTLIRSMDPGGQMPIESLRSISENSVQSSDAGGPLRIARLIFTRREAEEILALVPKSERLQAFDFSANRAAATNPELGHYRFVHFATHGVLDTAHPELSGIVLSLFDRQGHEQDGYLRVHDIYNLKLPVELVTLSGCRTGLGKEIKGEGLIGLTRAFMYAGAVRLMVSLWDVSDESSAKLMGQFYKKMLARERLKPAAALRAAQLELLQQERWQAPYYWSAFVLQGEPR
jgi:CHAT domain-containing protein/Tfp pilus assembly protein PilF